MTIYKRTLLYLRRKSGKTITLFLLLFIISAFVLSCFSILYVTDGVAKNMRTTVGASVSVGPYFSISYSDGSVVQASAREESVVTEKNVQDIMAAGGIKYYNAEGSGYAKSGELSFIPGNGATDENSMGEIKGNTYSALNSYFLDGTFELVEGRHITPEDENVIIINQSVAVLSGLGIGDEVTLSPASVGMEDGVYVDLKRDTDIFITATVIGIYKELTEQSTAVYQPTAGLQANIMFSDHTLLAELSISAKGEYKNGAAFYIEDPENLGQTVTQIENSDFYDAENFIIKTNDFNYQKIVSGLTTIQNLVKILLLCVCIVSAAVLLLILALRIRGRVNEAGILMSVGIPKRAVMGQFVAEIIIIAFIAFACSLPAANIISNELSENIIESLEVMEVDEQVLQTGLKSDISIDYSMSCGTMAFIFVIQLFLVVSSAVLASTSIIRLKPKEILSRMS